jgi:hypothetical protein
MYIEINPRKLNPKVSTNFGAINFKEESEISLVQIELNQGRICPTGSTNQRKNLLRRINEILLAQSGSTKENKSVR